jgi:gliding motility-associated-like protein
MGYKPSRRLLHLLGPFWVVVCFFFFSNPVYATHIRAGDIVAKSDTTMPEANRNPFRFFFTMEIYLNTRSPIREDVVTIDNGDGTTQRVQKASENPVNPDTYRVIFRWEHTYPAGGTYRICWTGINRNEGILNMSNSVAQTFFICTTIVIDPQLGINRTPVLTVPPIDRACTGQIWVHNPGAFDADGDSVSFKMRVPLRNDPAIGGGVGPVPGYRSPEQVGAGQQEGGGGPATFTLNEITGQITWNAPATAGEYNIAFAIEEWREGRKIGEVIRDMQILVLPCQNRRPRLQVPRDICVVAGTLVEGRAVATDPDGDRIRLTALSGIIPPATFSLTADGPGRAEGLFRWQTDCQDVRAQPYQVVFRAEDIPGGGGTPPLANPLVDLQTWRIRVVGPPPQNLQAVVLNRNIQLTWDPYLCQNASQIHIYRREGSSGFRPDSCQTGVPPETGYVRIASVPAGQAAFLDDNQGQGLRRSTTYCYLIYAEFPLPSGGESLASVEVCATLDANIPLLTNVSVLATDAQQGQMLVRWTQPREGMGQLTAPFRYRVLRTEGQTRTGPFAQVVFETQNLADTSFVDPGLNTLERAYSYKLEFYHSAGLGQPIELVDSSTAASSVRLAAAPAPLAAGQPANAINLSWTYDVPWNNAVLRHSVFRRINGTFVFIGEVNGGPSGGTFTDRGEAKEEPGLVPGREYCYYVTTQGTYGNPRLPDRLLNDSQVACLVLPDRTPPCPPALSVNDLDCEAPASLSPPLSNRLTWVPDLSPGCEQGIAFYTLYFRPPGEEEFTALAQTPELAFLHGELLTTAGCYYVTATDTAGNQSGPSNTVCQEACRRYELPNVFTPNGDGTNDVFRPDPRSVAVRAVRFTVFNRWGVRVYRGQDDPLINWAGVSEAGQPLSEGTYYYQAEVEFYTLDPATANQTFKGWVEIVR